MIACFSCATKKDHQVETLKKALLQQNEDLLNKCNQGNNDNCAIFVNNISTLEGRWMALAYTKKRCEKKEQVFCYLNAKYEYLDGNIEEANKLMEKYCNENSVEACLFLSTGFILPDRNKIQANSYLKKACKLGSLYGCVFDFKGDVENKESFAQLSALKKKIKEQKKDVYQLGLHLAESLKDISNEERIKTLREFCSYGDLSSCYYLAVLENKDEKGKLLSLSSTYCEKDVAYACLHACGFEKQKGNQSSAEYYCQKGCEEHDSDSCFQMGYWRHIEKDHDSAKIYYDLSCNRALPQSCHNLGLIHEKEGHVELSRRYFKVSCELKNIDSCLRLAYLEGKDDKQDLADRYAKKACELGSDKGCYSHGVRLHQNKKNDAREFFSKSCDSKYAPGCSGLCLMDAEAGDIKAAKKHFLKACSFSRATFCGNYREKKPEDIEVSTDDLKRYCHYDDSKPWWYWVTIVGLGIVGASSVH